MQIPSVCDQCGTSLLRYSSHIAKHVFCNKECRRLFITTPLEERFWQYVYKTACCWLWQGTMHKQGYGIFATVPRTDTSRKYRVITAHRMVWILTYGPISDKLNVCHNCPGGDNPRCINPAHLFVGTQQENIRDGMAKGRINFSGAHSPCAKLTETQARYVLAMKGIKSQRQLSQELGVAASTIQWIHTRKNWKCLTTTPMNEDALRLSICCAA